MPHEPRADGWQVLRAFDAEADPDSDVPPWAIPGGIEPIRPARRPAMPRPGDLDDDPGQADDPRRASGPGHAGDLAQENAGRGREKPGRSRVAQARRRRSKRRLFTWGGVLVAVAVVVAAVYFLNKPAPQVGGPITTLQKGEFRTVPDACRALAVGSVRQYLSGAPKSVQTFNYPDDSQCSFTVDAKPVFRVLTITMQAYQPSLDVPGNGSATTNATYTFSEQRQILAKPPRHTPAPPATITPITGLGSEAFSAVQVFRIGAVTDRVIVLVRYRNVLITVNLQGQVSGGFGPVSIDALRSDAQQAAHDLLGQVQVLPTVGS